MIGDGPERIKAEELCRKLGLAKGEISREAKDY